MKLLSLAVCALLSATSLAASYPITGNTVNCRSGPGTSYGVKKSYKKGQKVSISCQTSGTSVNGNNIWDKTSDGCYVADYYVKTGKNGYVTSKCGGGSKPPSNGGGKVPGPMKNDYPYSGRCSGIDPWRYYKCQCTSFVAYRINSRLGVKFHNHYKGPNWGNANTWDNAARSTGVPVNSKPVPGCVAQTNAGSYGHVAWVAKVSGSSVTIEEYNYGRREAYSTRTVPRSAFNYIHVKV